MDTFLLLLRVGLSLAVVVVLLWLAQKKLGKSARSGFDDLRVVSRRNVGQKAAVVLVDTDGRRFLLGVTEHSVNVLHSSDAPEPGEEAPATVGAAQLFDRALAAASGLRSARGPALELRPDAEATVPGAGTRPAHSGGRRTAAPPLPSVPPRPSAPEGALAGSILSPATWSQARAALRKDPGQ